MIWRQVCPGHRRRISSPPLLPPWLGGSSCRPARSRGFLLSLSSASQCNWSWKLSSTEPRTGRSPQSHKVLIQAEPWSKSHPHPMPSTTAHSVSRSLLDADRVVGTAAARPAQTPTGLRSASIAHSATSFHKRVSKLPPHPTLPHTHTYMHTRKILTL